VIPNRYAKRGLPQKKTTTTWPDDGGRSTGMSNRTMFMAARMAGRIEAQVAEGDTMDSSSNIPRFDPIVRAGTKLHIPFELYTMLGLQCIVDFHRTHVAIVGLPPGQGCTGR